MAVVEKQPRKFIPEGLKIESWDDIAPFFQHLIDEEPEGVSGLKAWLRDLSELEAFLEEEGAWRYIRMTVDTNDAKAAERYRIFITDIQPKVAPLVDRINHKLASHPFAGELKGDAFRIYLRGIRSAIRLFREANIPLNTELQELAQKYSSISGGMSVEVGSERLTMQEAAARLRSTDRSERETVYRAMAAERLQHKDAVEALFDTMVQLRDKLASNADYPDYRSYMFASLGRFDYTIQDCIDFQNSIEETIVPLAREINESRRIRLGVEHLKPWDLAVDPEGREPLKPFQTADELLNKSIECFGKLNPFFADCLTSMDELGHFDLASKKGKAPGGYNYPLYESGLPFIFMNAVGTQRDLVTMMHEGGHAVHSVLSHPLELTSFKSCPSEVAELASMSMELFSMEYWKLFYPNEADLTRAKREHLEDILTTLPWIARIDAFQHWIYTNPRHSREDRANTWLELGRRFDVADIDWTGLEEANTYSWHKQLHLFEVPFYYIEYGIAQLGAIGIWRNYKQNGAEALEQYKEALALGYTRGVKEIYKAAGIPFDFTGSYLAELAGFVQSELVA